MRIASRVTVSAALAERACSSRPARVSLGAIRS